MNRQVASVMLLTKRGSMVADALLDVAMHAGFFHSLNARISCGTLHFGKCKYFSACVVDYCKDPCFTIKVLIDMHRGEAMTPLVANPCFLTDIIFVFLLGKAKLNKNLMNTIMRNIRSIIEFDKTFYGVLTPRYLRYAFLTNSVSHDSIG